MQRYRLVTQQDAWGCGVSCVASILGLRYIEAKRRLEKYKKGQIDAKPKGLELESIIKVLTGSIIRVEADRDSAEQKFVIFGSSREGFAAEVVAKIKGQVVIITVYLL